jgi:transmembrane sensor
MNTQRRAIEEAATHWLVLHDAGLSPEQEEEFSRWREANPDHAEVYRELRRTWMKLDRMRESALAPWLAAELDEISSPRPMWPVFSRVRSVVFTTAAAALVVVGLALRTSSENQAAFTTVAATEIGGVKTIDLPDHSLVRLNTNSAVRVDYRGQERRVTLVRGEAFFSVAKNPARPFFVRAAGVDVRAVGTAFNVRLRPEHVEVVVTEGKVRVNDVTQGHSVIGRAPAESTYAAANRDLLVAGESLLVPSTVSPESAPTVVAPAALAPTEIDRVLAWRDQRLVFSSTPLGEIVAEFNRYNRRQLIIANAELARRRFGGAFQANDPGTFVQLLQTTGVLAEERESGTVLRAAPVDPQSH